MVNLRRAVLHRIGDRKRKSSFAQGVERHYRRTCKGGLGRTHGKLFEDVRLKALLGGEESSLAVC